MGLTNVEVAVDLPQSEMGIGLLRQGWRMVATGEAEVLLVVRATSHRNRTPLPSLDDRGAAGLDQFELPMGVGPTVLHALRWRRYLHTYDRSPQEIYPVVRNAWQRAQKNSAAVHVNASAPSLEQYLASPPVADPLRLLDCDMPVSGAVAFVLCEGDRARDLVDSPCYINGFQSRLSKRRGVPRLLGLREEEVSTWHLYDGFSYLLVESIEYLGLADTGAGLDFLAQRRVGSGQDEIEINTGGGSLGEGRLHGMGHLREAVLQTQGRAVGRQSDAPGFAVVDIGTDIAGSTVVMGAEKIWLARRGPMA